MHKGKGASEVIREHTQDLQTGNTDLQAEDSKGQFDMYSSWFQFNWVGLWKNTVPLFYALFFQSKNHLHLCFSLFSSTPLLPHFHCPHPDHCVEMYMHWSITHEEDFFG